VKFEPLTTISNSTSAEPIGGSETAEGMSSDFIEDAPAIVPFSMGCFEITGDVIGVDRFLGDPVVILKAPCWNPFLVLEAVILGTVVERTRASFSSSICLRGRKGKNATDQ
jgi:hypothetical protein